MVAPLTPALTQPVITSIPTQGPIATIAPSPTQAFAGASVPLPRTDAPFTGAYPDQTRYGVTQDTIPPEMLQTLSNEGHRLYFSNSIYPLLREFCHQHDIDVSIFTPLLRSHSNGIFIIGLLLEMKDIVLRVGVETILLATSRYPDFYDILSAIRGEALTGRKNGVETTEYRHSLIHDIHDAAIFELYAEKLHVFLESTRRLESSHYFQPSYFVERYGIENLPALGRIAGVIGDTAFQWKAVWKSGKEERITEVERFLEHSARPLLYRFSLDAVADLTEVTDGELKPISDHIVSLEEDYPTPDEMICAIKTLHRRPQAPQATATDHVDVEGTEFTLIDTDLALSFTHIADPIDGIFKFDGNRGLLRAHGADAVTHILMPGRDQDFFLALNACATRISSPEALLQWGRSIGDIHHLTRAILPHYIHVIPDERALADFDSRVKRLYDLERDSYRLEACFKKHAARIDSLEEVDTVLFEDEKIRQLVRKYGIDAFASSLGLTSQNLQNRHRLLQIVSALRSDLQNIESLARIAPLATVISEESATTLVALAGYPATIEDLEKLIASLNRIVASCSQGADKKQNRNPKEVLAKILRAKPHFQSFEDVLFTAEAWAISIEDRLKDRTQDIYKLLFGNDKEEQDRNKCDKTYILQALTKAPLAVFRGMDPNLRLDREVALEAIRHWGRLFDKLDTSLKDDPDFQRQAFEINFNVCDYIENPPAEMKARSNSIREAIKNLNISFPTRFNTRTVEAIISNRLQIGNLDPAKVALMVYPKKDHNYAFEMNSIETFMNEGWLVLYFEMGDTADGQALLGDLQALGERERIPVLELGAHSCITSMSFGASDPDVPSSLDTDESIDKNRDTTLDIFSPTIGLAPIIEALRCYLSPQFVGIVSGCSTGGGEALVMNVSNFLANMFPGSTWLSPTVPSHEMGYDFERRSGQPSLPRSVIYPNGKLYRAHVPISN